MSRVTSYLPVLALLLIGAQPCRAADPFGIDACKKWFQNLGQENAAAKPAPVPISFVIANPKPVLPSPAHLNEAQATALLEAARPEDREAFRFLLEQIRASHVGFPQFREALRNSAREFVRANRPRVDEGNFVSFSYFQDSKHTVAKSNFWTLELLMEEAEGLGLPKTLETYADLPHMVAKMRESGIDHILITDDASFSGDQLDSILKQIAHALENHPAPDGKGVTIHLVIPYMTDWALARLQKPHDQLNIRAYVTARVPTFSKTLDQAVQDGKLSEAAKKRLGQLLYFAEPKTLLYFDHKIPDYISGVTSHEASNKSILEKLVIPVQNNHQSFPLIDAGPSPYGPK